MAKILIIDDDADHQSICRSILEYRGHEVAQVENGADGLNLARRIKPHLIFLDIAMPVMNGWEAIAIIRADPLLDRALVVAFTAQVEEAVEEKAMAAGFDGFLSKPCPPSRTVAMVEQLVGPSERSPPLD